LIELQRSKQKLLRLTLIYFFKWNSNLKKKYSPEYVDIISASEIVLPLKLACEIRNWKVIVIALDCIQV